MWSKSWGSCRSVWGKAGLMETWLLPHKHKGTSQIGTVHLCWAVPVPLPQCFQTSKWPGCFWVYLLNPTQNTFCVQSNWKHIAEEILGEVMQVSQASTLQSNSRPGRRRGWWRLFKQCPQKSLSSLFLSFDIFFFSKSSVSHFSFISPVERAPFSQQFYQVLGWHSSLIHPEEHSTLTGQPWGPCLLLKWGIGSDPFLTTGTENTRYWY